MSYKKNENIKKPQKKRRLNRKETFDLIKTGVKSFLQENSFMHGAALAYYTIFALIPIIYLSITYFGIIVGQEQVVRIVEDLLTDQMGIDDITPFTNLMYEWDIGKGGSPLLKTVGVLALIFSSTALFNALRKSINHFFGISPKKRYSAILENLLKRLVSFGLMAFFGLIIIIIYFSQSVVITIGKNTLPENGIIREFVFFIIEHASLIIINFLVFTFVFKFLHDGIVKWKLAMLGAAFTSVFLYFGQLLINYYLSNYFFAADSGIAGTLLAVLTWIFYTSQIIFLGAKYMSVYAEMKESPIVAR